MLDTAQTASDTVCGWLDAILAYARACKAA